MHVIMQNIHEFVKSGEGHARWLYFGHGCSCNNCVIVHVLLIKNIIVCAKNNTVFKHERVI